MKLGEYIQSYGTIRACADHLGVSPTHLINIRDGNRTASPKVARRIEENSGGSVSFEEVYGRSPGSSKGNAVVSVLETLEKEKAAGGDQ